jgi:Sec-independent protein translocase protein TatA
MNDLDVARQVADLISEFRKEVADRVREEIEKEAAEVESSGFDPARGRGRGPRWLDGGLP